MASKYQKDLAARRKTADITRLADQYKRNVEALTGEQDKAFSAYRADVGAKMGPYESALADYQVSFTAYESQAAAYRQRLDQYQAVLADIAANPKETVNTTSSRLGKISRGVEGWYTTVEGREYTEAQLAQMGWEPVYDWRSQGRTQWKEGIKAVVRDRAVPTFTEKAPEAPVAPTAPQIDEFDTTQFDARRAQLETGFQRELGERKGARMTAVSRKTARPLLGGQS